ncbi:uncharacterized protein J4E92_001815 [Alternaria infectoria]|uniref:uncharacterized protein n=1 Tax=Alternaria infectoria TaxID=45303 RepID=UPI002220CADC|nr:uncharacterized protein J4E92_001815 [Alternaria infectoria]KAI4937088.1 hypothetical protein J4E92_001815 [Alternaria infectoria]
MGRWTDLDSVTSLVHLLPNQTTHNPQDAERLPPGFERIGYDADTQTYTFRDASGRIYESEPGNRYGELRATGEHSQPPSDEQRREQDEMIEEGNRSAVRMMLPFALLVLVFLFLVFKLVNRSDGPDTVVAGCGDGERQLRVEKGNTCWAIAEANGLSVDDGNEGSFFTNPIGMQEALIDYPPILPQPDRRLLRYKRSMS